MAKCSMCNSRKGKRKCMAVDAFICSLCCGQSRHPDKCQGCSFYKGDSQNRNYRKVPYYSIRQMSDSMKLQDISNVIESILCRFDAEAERENNFTDKTAIQLLELAFDRYYFRDTELSFSDKSSEILFERMSQLIEKDLPDTANEQLIKVMASIYRSIQRRTNGGRAYLDFAQEYVGPRVGPSTRVLSI